MSRNEPAGEGAANEKPVSKLAAKFFHKPENFLAKAEQLGAGYAENQRGQQAFAGNFLQRSLRSVQVVETALQISDNEGSLAQVSPIRETVKRAGELGGRDVVSLIRFAST